MFNRNKTLLCLVICLFSLVSCRHMGKDAPPRAVVRDGVAITLRDQKLTVIRKGKKVKDYRISSSKFGIGSNNGSHCTPLGIHAVSAKVGEGQPSGMVFKGCRPTGEVISANSGRDPIVTRVIQLAGLEPSNRNSHRRRIYIHGTPEERLIGRPASYGCIRMRSADVLDLYPLVYRGMPVAIEPCSQATYLKAEKQQNMRSVVIPSSVVASLPAERTRTVRRTAGQARHSSALARNKRSATPRNRRLTSRTAKKRYARRRVSN